MKTLERCCCYSFYSLTSSCIDIVLMIISGLSFFFSFLVLVIIKWKNLDSTSLGIMLVIFFLITSLFVITILIFCWRKKGTIKSTTKELAKKLSTAGIIISLVTFIFCILANIVFSEDFSQANHPCRSKITYIEKNLRNLFDKNSIDCSKYNSGVVYKIVTTGHYFISYFCLTYTEIAMIVAIFLWRSSNIRIIEGIEGVIVQEEDLEREKQEQQEKEKREEQKNRERQQQEGKNEQYSERYQPVIGKPQPTNPQRVIIEQKIIIQAPIQPEYTPNNNQYLPLGIPQKRNLPPIQSRDNNYNNINNDNNINNINNDNNINVINEPGYNYPVMQVDDI